MPAHFFAAGAIDIAGDANLAAFGLALAGEHLDELALAVAGDAGDADDFPPADGKRDATDRDRPGVVERAQLVQLQPCRADLADPGRLNGQFLRADHHAGHAVRREVVDLAVAGKLAAPQDRHLVRKRHHLAEFVRDHQDRQIAT